MKDAETRRWQRATAAFLILTTLLRCCQLPALELAPDEAYYWDWSRRLDWGYYDQGPMIAYVIRATTALFGTNEFGVRFGALLASLGALACCFLLAHRMFSARAGFLAVLLLALTPLMALGSVIATYDPLLVFFWAAALLFLERALHAPERAAQLRAWLLAGVATGLGFLSKHTMLLLIPCLLLYLALSPGHRFWLRRPEPYLAFLACLLLYGGVFWWNAHHHWWTFRHLLFLAAKTPGTFGSRFGDFLGSQALLLGPGLFVAALWAAWKGWRDTRSGAQWTEEGAGWTAKHPADTRALFLICMGLPVFLFFCLLTLKSKVQGNWPPCAWLSLTVLLAAQWSALLERAGQEARKARRALVLTGALSAIVTLLILVPSWRYALGLQQNPPEIDVSNQAYGWRAMAAEVQKAREEMERQGRKPAFLAGNGYQFPALMAFYLPDHPRTYDLFLNFRLTMYAAHVEELKQFLGQDALFVSSNRVEDPYLREIFTQVEWREPFPIWRRPYYQEPVRVIEIARCYGFRRYVGLKWAVGG